MGCVYATLAPFLSWDQLEMALILVLVVKQTARLPTEVLCPAAPHRAALCIGVGQDHRQAVQSHIGCIHLLPASRWISVPSSLDRLEQ